MTFADFTTRIDGNGALNNAADLLLTPLRVVSGGETYRVITDPDLQKPQFFKTAETTQLVVVIAERTLAFIALILLSIPVAVGAPLKVIALQDERVAHLYESLGNIPKDEKFVLIKGLSREPHWGSTDLETAAQTIDPNFLLNTLDDLAHSGIIEGRNDDHCPEVIPKASEEDIFFDNVSEHNEYQDPIYWRIRRGIKLLIDCSIDGSKDWDKVSDGWKAADALNRQLKVLTYLCLNADSKTIASALYHLDIRFAGSCAPTRIECTSRAIKELVSEDKGLCDIKNRILSMIQQYKEETINNADAKSKGGQWHVLNYAREHFGEEFGLDRSNLEFDTFFDQDNDRKLSYQQIRDLLYGICTKEKLIQCVRDQLLVHNEDQTCSVLDEETLSDVRDWVRGIIQKKYHIQASDFDHFHNKIASENKGVSPLFVLRDVYYPQWDCTLPTEIPTDYAFQLLLEDLGILG